MMSVAENDDDVQDDVAAITTDNDNVDDSNSIDEENIRTMMLIDDAVGDVNVSDYDNQVEHYADENIDGAVSSSSRLSWPYNVDNEQRRRMSASRLNLHRSSRIASRKRAIRSAQCSPFHAVSLCLFLIFCAA